MGKHYGVSRGCTTVRISVRRVVRAARWSAGATEERTRCGVKKARGKALTQAGQSVAKSVAAAGAKRAAPADTGRARRSGRGHTIKLERVCDVWHAACRYRLAYRCGASHVHLDRGRRNDAPAAPCRGHFRACGKLAWTGMSRKKHDATSHPGNSPACVFFARLRRLQIENARLAARDCGFPIARRRAQAGLKRCSGFSTGCAAGAAHCQL